MLIDAGEVKRVIQVNFSAYSDPAGDLELACPANATTLVIDAFPTTNSRQLVLGIIASSPVTVIIRKWFGASKYAVDSTSAVGAGASLVTDSALLECAEILITTGANPTVVHVTAIARP